ncbi:hypothetical protein CAEBREN_16410 [Caenorhabditis brenneri]|uniref:Uncharacterized protein n=1 Tax=Caenorhabditis brenneri TaxID=135651 RepID=G0MPM2_CAEBE|nr:hypothetical protein CAEBREN_16410 [Caenorhabditis brenneri]
MEVDEALEAQAIITAVFNNPDLVEKFLEGATDDIRDSMQFRLVNRTFREACHGILRQTQRKAKIEYIKRECSNRDQYLKMSGRVYINHHPLRISNVENYFHFLKGINVNIESVVIKNLWGLKASFQKDLHDSINKVLIGDDRYALIQLIGMNEICKESCEDCFSIPNHCVEYGPLRIDHLKKSFPEPREFEKLIVTDYLLDDIANSCIEPSNSKEDCYKALSDLIPSNISCKTLVLKISEGRKQWRDPNQPPAERIPEHHFGGHPYEQREMPREVLEFMLKQWKVQLVSLKFVGKNHQDSYTKGEWTQNAWFSALCFKDHVEERYDTDFKVNEVLVDLTDSSNTLSNMLHSRRIGMQGQQGSLVTNIRRVFFCDKIIIQFSHFHPGSSSIEDITEGMMNEFFSEEQVNLDIEVIYYSRVQDDTTYFIDLWNLDYEKLPAVFKNFDYTHIPTLTPEWHWSMEGQGVDKEGMKKKEWIGSGCQMVNRRKKCTAEWKILVQKNPFKPDRSMYAGMGAAVFGMF